MGAAIKELIAHNNGQVKAVLGSFAVPLGRPWATLFTLAWRLVAGLSAGLGFLVPPRSRVTASPA